MSGALQTMPSTYASISVTFTYVFQLPLLLVLVGRRTNDDLCCESEYQNLTTPMDHSRLSHK